MWLYHNMERYSKRKLYTILKIQGSRFNVLGFESVWTGLRVRRSRKSECGNEGLRLEFGSRNAEGGKDRHSAEGVAHGVQGRGHGLWTECRGLKTD